ncbi:MAG: peptidylprolyl isomerase [Candidatus Mariimomonas ferrooxydans]
MKKLLLMMLLAIFMVGCNSKESPADSVLAKVNTTTITKEDFIKKINRLPEWAKSRFKGEAGKKEFLEELIKEELMYQEAKKQGVNKEKEFQDKIKEFEKMTLISTLLKNEIEGKAKVDAKEVRDFYDEKQNEFMTGPEVKASHILVNTETEAEDVLKRIQKGEDFSKLAVELTIDKGTAKNGGDLGFFGSGRMVPEFEKAAFGLKPGEVSSPVKTKFGYHIIKITDKKEGKPRDFEEVKTSIEKRLSAEKQRTVFDSYIEKLKEKANKIEINEETLKTLTVGETPEAKN